MTIEDILQTKFQHVVPFPYTTLAATGKWVSREAYGYKMIGQKNYLTEFYASKNRDFIWSLP